MSIDLSKYNGKGLIGIENLGNTCFLNSCIQILNHTYELNHLLDSAKVQKTMKVGLEDTKIIVEWNDLRRIMWSGNGVVNPGRFVNNIHTISSNKNRELFTGFTQNDMPEFLLFLIECMHNGLSRKISMRINGKIETPIDEVAVECYKMLQRVYSNEYSEIMDYFYGIYVSEIVSIHTNKRYSLRPENFFILDLPILDENKLMKTLYECFDLFTKEEYLEGENAWYNEKTNEKENVKKRIRFWNFPKIVVITLRRFTPDGQNKISEIIDFPIHNLDLSKYVYGYNASSYVYDLYGVCNHYGGVFGGHYTSYVKNAENKWVHYDDRNLEILTNERNVITQFAYCLFYRKKNNLL